MRKRWWFMLAAVPLLAAGIYVAWASTQAPVDLPARTATVVRQDIENTVSSAGSIAPAAQLLLNFALPGTVASVAAAEGDIVAAGQTLATLDSADLARTLAQAEQAVLVQELTLARLKAPADPNAVAAAEAALAGARATLALALRRPDQAALDAAATSETLAWNAYLQADAQRNAVVDNPFTPVDERAPLDAAAGLASVNFQIARHQRVLAARAPSRAAIASARAQVAQAQAALNQLLAGPSAFDLQAAELQLALARGQRDRARLALDETTLVAPQAGVIAALNVKVGERTPSDRPAVVLVDTREYHLDVAVDEIDVARLAAGQAVSVTLDALPEQSFSGRVARIATLATSAGGVVSYAVRVELDAPDERVRAGMTANALVVTERRAGALVVPNWAVRIDRTSGQAYVPVERAGSVSEVAVTLGLRNETVSEVLAGLSEGERIVVVEQRETLSFFGGGR
jgi:HlyD family secretion protein